MFSLPDSWLWDFWLAEDTSADGQHTYHLFFLHASRALHDPDRRHLPPVDQIGRHRMADRSAQMTAIRIVQGPGRVQEEQMIGAFAFGGIVLSEPEVPQPGIGKREHDQPFTPLEAMLLMKDRWKAMNSARIGIVIREA